MNLLIIDPDNLSAHVLAFAARRRGHKARVAASLRGVAERMPFSPAASIVALQEVDGALPGIVATIRERFADIPVIAVLERSREPDPLAALDAGVDDVIRAPYHPHEVVKRAEMRAAARVTRDAEAGDATRIGDLEVDLGRYSARKNGIELRLTKLELRLLFCLTMHHGHVSPTEKLLTFGWETTDPPDPSLLKTHVSHLRSKLRDAGGTPAEIISRHSLGYTLRLQTEPRVPEAAG